MQRFFWYGTSWPSNPLQWQGALIDTIFAATERSLIKGVREYRDMHRSDVDMRALAGESDIRTYYSHIQAYFDHEDTIQLFSSAYDDVQWVVLEWLEAIRFLEQYPADAGPTEGDLTRRQEDIAKYAHRAHVFYDAIQDKYNTTNCGGGITWNPRRPEYKNAITNGLFVSSSIAMYLYFPGDTNTDPYPHPDYYDMTNRPLPRLEPLGRHDPLFLQNAINEWAWFQSQNFTNAQGLIVDGFHISPGQSTCDQKNEMVYTYNQGVMLTGLRGLWEATGDPSYLDDGHQLITAVMNATGWVLPGSIPTEQWAGLGRHGILEDYCDAAAQCSQDNLIFKGAYFQHLDFFCAALPTSSPIVPEITFLASSALAACHLHQCRTYTSWIQHNAHAALRTRDAYGIMGEWWGACYADISRTDPSSPSPSSYVVPKPAGSWDIVNDPALLALPPFACDGRNGCEAYHDETNNRRVNDPDRDAAEVQEEEEEVVMVESLPHARRHRGRVENVWVESRSVETQAQGLSVVRAAMEAMLRG